MVIFGLITLLTSFVFGITPAFYLLTVLHVLTTWLGFALRQGTKISNSD